LFAGKPLPNATLRYVEGILPGVGIVLAGTSGRTANAKNPVSFSSMDGAKVATPKALFFAPLQPGTSTATVVQAASQASKSRPNSITIPVDTGTSMHASLDGLFVPLSSPRQ
jgi:hypothetical protein